MVTDKVWKLPAIVDRFLSYRTAIPLAQEQIAVMMAILKSGSETVERFLDLGCGEGILGAAILGEHPSSRGVFVDFSDPMLEQARAQLAEYTDQLTFINLDYGDPAWVKETQVYGPFDAIVSGYSIHHQPDERKLLLYKEIYNLIRLGGWFVNIEHIAPLSPLATELFNDHMVDAYFEIEKQKGGTRTRDEMAKVFLNRPDKDANILAPVDTQCDWLRDIGFELVDCYFRIYELAVFAGRKPNRKSKFENR
jgi:SAM-dependent methyltransferase